MTAFSADLRPYSEAAGIACRSEASSPEQRSPRLIRIEYLYLDLTVCDRCIGTGDVLSGVIETLRPVLEEAGYTVEYVRKEMSNASLAEEYRFLSSPTIRVNGRDIFDKITETNCSCCGDIAGVPVACRSVTYEGRSCDVPPRAILLDAVLRAVYTHTEAADETGYVMPKNLCGFYEGKKRLSEKGSV